MTEPESRQSLSVVLSRPEGEINLAEAALLIACEEYPDLDVPRYLKHLDDMGLALRARLADEPRPERAVMALNRYLFQEEGFHGNTDEYYDPRNSYLNDVIDRRVGIPDHPLHHLHGGRTPPGSSSRASGSPATSSSVWSWASRPAPR